MDIAEIVIKPCNHTQLAGLYGVSTKVLRARLKPYQHLIGKRNGYSYSLEQLFIIFDKLGTPYKNISTEAFQNLQQHYGNDYTK
ncbi:MAG: hypothetical protein WDM90_16630 [Ferruginibacter sp.]